MTAGKGDAVRAVVRRSANIRDGPKPGGTARHEGSDVRSSLAPQDHLALAQLAAVINDDVVLRALGLARATSKAFDRLAAAPDGSTASCEVRSAASPFSIASRAASIDGRPVRVPGGCTFTPFISVGVAVVAGAVVGLGASSPPHAGSSKAKSVTERQMRNSM